MLPQVQETSVVSSTSSARNTEENVAIIDNIKQEQFSDNDDDEEWCRAAVLLMDHMDDEETISNRNSVPRASGAETMESSRVPLPLTTPTTTARPRQANNSTVQIPVQNEGLSSADGTSTGRRQPLNKRRRSEPPPTTKNGVPIRPAKKGKFTPDKMKPGEQQIIKFLRPIAARTAQTPQVILATNVRRETRQKNSDGPPSRRNVRAQRLHFSSTDTLEEEEEDESSQSSTSSNSEPRIEGQQIAIQQMSIHKIRLESLQPQQQWVSDTRNDSSISDEERAILEIMKRFEMTQKANKSLSQEPYDRQRQMEIKLSKKETQFLGGRSTFQATLYVQQTESSDNLLRLYDCDKSSKNIHMIWFFYRPGDLFALTTNQAWNVVHQFADFNFPGQIAARICSQDGPKETEDKVLVGYILQDSKLRKGGQGQNPHDSPVLCTSYTAELRDSASILKFPCFKDERNNTKLKKTSVKFGFGLLRFLRTFFPTDFVLILDHLSVIQKGEDTFKCLTENYGNNNKNGHDESQNVLLDEIQLRDHHSNDDDEDASIRRSQNDNLATLRTPQSIPSSSSSSFAVNSSQTSTVSSLDSDVSVKEKDTEIYRKNLTKVTNEVRVKLDNTLAGLFWNEIDLNRRNRNRNKESKFSAFHFSYKHDDFYNARSFTLMYKAKNGELHEIKQLAMSSLSARPTLRDVLNAIVRETSDFLNPVKHYDTSGDIEKYKEELKRLKIQYTNDKGQIKSNDLFSFTEGEMLLYENLYWRVNNMWCTVSPEYAVNVDFCWYLPFLKKNYQSAGSLNLNDVRWPSRRQRNEMAPTIDIVKDYFVKQFQNSVTNKFFQPPKGSPFLFDLAQVVRVSTQQQQQQETNVGHGQEKNLQKKIYFHFISTNFRCDTRDLCERMNRCLQEILKMRVLSAKQPSKSKNTKNSKNLKGFVGAFKKFYNENFKDSLTVHDFIKIVQNSTMVYILPNCGQAEAVISGPMDAFLGRSNNNNNNNQQQQQRQPSLEDERKIPEKITPKALENFLFLDSQNKDNKDRLTMGVMKQLCSRGIEDDATESEREDDDDGFDENVITNCAKLIYEQLENENYVSQNIVTADLLYASMERFRCPIVDRLDSTAMWDSSKKDLVKKKIYLLVSKFVSKLRSLRAKLELRELDNEIKKFPGIQLKICEIQEDDEDEDDD